MAIIIFFRIAGSAHRALAASRNLSRREGSLRAARNFAPTTGSAHRAFAAARYRSRISGVRSNRELTRVRFIPLGPRKKWAVASRGRQPKVWCGVGLNDRLQNMVNDGPEQGSVNLALFLIRSGWLANGEAMSGAIVLPFLHDRRAHDFA